MNPNILISIAVIMLPSILYVLLDSSNRNMLSKRKIQSKELLRENVLKKRLEEMAESNVKYSRKYAVETLCLQAGYKLSYGEFMIISVISALTIGLIVGTALNNFLQGIMFLFIGFILPRQIIMIIRNRRVSLMERQIGSFMQMVLKRYDVTKDFAKSLELTLDEFRGEEPLYTELKQAVLKIKLGSTIADAMDGLARRTGNKYMERLSDYYKIASTLGTEEVRKKLLVQAYIQFEENRKAKAFMKKEIAGPKREAYVMLISIPIFVVYMIVTNDTYIQFMTTTTLGKIGTVLISATFFGCFWFINAKIGAPIED